MDTDIRQYRQERRRRTAASGLVMGGVIVTVGLLLLLSNMRIIHLHDLWEYWPLILVFFGVARIVECRRPASLAWGGMMALVGALLLMENLDLLRIDFDYVWPLVVIGFGLTMLWRALERGRNSERGAGGAIVSGNPNVGIWAIFSGVKRRIDAQDFQGGDVAAIFGGVQLDLRQAAIAAGEASIDVNAIFGGIEVFVPSSWTVTMRGVPIFGGFEDKTIGPRPDQPPSGQRLVLNGVCIFGGVAVKN